MRLSLISFWICERDSSGISEERYLSILSPSSFSTVKNVFKVLLLIVQQQEHCQKYGGHGHEYIRHVEDREIDELKVKEIHYISLSYPVDEIAQRPGDEASCKNGMDHAWTPVTLRPGVPSSA